jgi:GMP synthase (glutamine-hydrolysing)
MKPFLLLATRAEDVPADEEYRLFLRFTGLSPDELVRVRMEAGPSEGGPGRVLGHLRGRRAVQRVGSDREEVTRAAARRGGDRRPSRRGGGAGLPFFGACYGVGTLGAHQGAAIDGTYREPISVIEVDKTGAGHDDPLLAGLPDRFAAFVGHKEAISALPATATLLVRGEACPVQMFRVGRNVYATQFHPECDVEGISTRIRAYADYGYFGADELDLTLAAVRRRPVVHTGSILRAFVERYAC